MAKDKLTTKFYKFIYKLDKENYKAEGKYTPDFDTWLKELNNNQKTRKKTRKKKMEFGEAMSSLAKNSKKNNKNFDKASKKVERNNKSPYKKKFDKKLEKKSKDIYSKQIEDYDKEIKKIKLNKNELKKAIIYSEIIGKPKAKR